MDFPGAAELLPDRLEFVRGALYSLERSGLRRRLRRIEGAPVPRVRVDGRDAVLLCSNNYLGLATDQRLKVAASRAVERFGCGATGSRLISGNGEAYEELESELAAFKGTEAIRTVRNQPELRTALWHNADRLRSGLGQLGLAVHRSSSPILPMLLHDERRTMAACRFLLRHGAFVQGIRPPTVPPGTARLRITPMASHTEDDLQDALQAFEKLQMCLRSPARRGGEQGAVLAPSVDSAT